MYMLSLLLATCSGLRVVDVWKALRKALEKVVERGQDPNISACNQSILSCARMWQGDETNLSLQQLNTAIQTNCMLGDTKPYIP